jgi:hypothetical protein
MRDHEAIAQAIEEAPKDIYGAFDEKWVLDRATELIVVNRAKEARRMAKAALNKCKRPGSNKSDGQLSLFGDEWPYEPDQILADDDGHLIQKRNAVPQYTDATYRRHQVNLEKQLVWVRRSGAEHNGYTTWIIEQMATGRPLVELQFDVWIKEAEVWVQPPIELQAD